MIIIIIEEASHGLMHPVLYASLADLSGTAHVLDVC